MDISRPASKQPIPAHAQRVFKGDIFDVWQWEQELYDGSTKIFEKVQRQDTVVIIPSTSDGKLIFVEDEQPARSTILTFPAGRMDKEGENPLECAQRELLEETGYASEDWSLYKAHQPITKVDWAIYIFVARGCQKVAEADPGPGERITVSLVTLDDIIAKVGDPRLIHDDLDVELIEAKYNPEARTRLEQILFG